MFIKSIPKMKSRNETDKLCPSPLMMNFSFGEYFDERTTEAVPNTDFKKSGYGTPED